MTSDEDLIEYLEEENAFLSERISDLEDENKKLRQTINQLTKSTDSEKAFKEAYKRD